MENSDYQKFVKQKEYYEKITSKYGENDLKDQRKYELARKVVLLYNFYQKR